MQKIIKQDLSGGEITNNMFAKYTWEKDEIAWYFCLAHNDVFKVQFTGKHWISGNKWSRDKIYQYKYLDSSGNKDLKTNGLDCDGISHGEEEIFFSEKQEAIDRGIAMLKGAKADYLKGFEDDMDRLTKYSKIKSNK